MGSPQIDPPKILSRLGQQTTIYLRDAGRQALVGDPITLTGYRRTETRIINSKQESLYRYEFGVKECCNQCRSGDWHHSAYLTNIEDLFEKPPLPVVTGEPLPASDVIHFVELLTRLWGEELWHTTEITFGGRWYCVHRPSQYEMAATGNDKPMLSIAFFPQARKNTPSASFFSEDEFILPAHHNLLINYMKANLDVLLGLKKMEEKVAQLRKQLIEVLANVDKDETA